VRINPGEFEDAFPGPDDEPPTRKRKKRPERARRMQPLPGAFVRVPIQWLTRPGRPHAFDPEARLFLHVLYRSRWGQRGVVVTDAVATEIGVPARIKRRMLRRLAGKGWIRIERRSRYGAPEVWPIVLSA
jgi:hypothetical protein